MDKTKLLYKIAIIFETFMIGLIILQWSRENTGQCIYLNSLATITENGQNIEIVLQGEKPLSQIDFLVVNDNLCKKGVCELYGVQKTDWFPIDNKNEYLCMYGGFNYAIWEFCDEDGKYIEINHCNNTFNSASGVNLENNCRDIVNIPEGAIKCRVYYLQTESLDTYLIAGLKGIVKGVLKGNVRAELKNRFIEIDLRRLYNQPLYICYGTFPASANEHRERIYSIETDQDGEATVKMNLYSGETIYSKSKNIKDFEIISTENIVIDREGEYGIEYDVNDTSMICKRVGDAQNLHTNYKVGEQWAGIFENDFDHIYPWSEIKECYLDQNGNKYYSRPKNIETDAMIEIPKFYVKRVRKGNIESIWISGTKKEEYELDPAFFDVDGRELEHIYIGRYLSSIGSGDIVTTAENVPLIDLSYNEIQDLIDKKGAKWNEIDLSTLNCLQRLWLVEYAVKNSQAIFSGYTESTFVHSSYDDPKISVSSLQDSNVIRIRDTPYNEKFSVGDSVAVFSYISENQYSPYLYWTDNYQNDNEVWQRKITDINHVLSDFDNEEYLEISFSGPAVDVEEKASIITNLPAICGVTDSLSYHTAEVVDKIGKASFKYRGIENLWGTVCVYVSGAYVDDGKLYFEDTIDSYRDMIIPVQKKGGGSALGYECAVKELSFLQENPFLLFPVKLSEGASLSNNFGDWFVYPKDEPDPFGRTEIGKKQYITYGMTWDLSIYGGLFAYRVYPTENTRMVENGARLIYK